VDESPKHRKGGKKGEQPALTEEPPADA
jgi:hypothetical protein